MTTFVLNTWTGQINLLWQQAGQWLHGTRCREGEMSAKGGHRGTLRGCENIIWLYWGGYYTGAFICQYLLTCIFIICKLYLNTTYFTSLKNIESEDFPGGPVVENLPADRGHRFDPWPRKIPHTVRQLRSPQLLKPMHPRTCALHQEKPLEWEACRQLKSGSHSPQLEKAHMQQQRPSTAKNK